MHRLVTSESRGPEGQPKQQSNQSKKRDRPPTNGGAIPLLPLPSHEGACESSDEPKGRRACRRSRQTSMGWRRSADGASQSSFSEERSLVLNITKCVAAVGLPGAPQLVNRFAQPHCSVEISTKHDLPAGRSTVLTMRTLHSSRTSARRACHGTCSERTGRASGRGRNALP